MTRLREVIARSTAAGLLAFSSTGCFPNNSGGESLVKPVLTGQALPSPRPLREAPVANWKDVRVPLNDKPYQVNDFQTSQSSPAGLRELYLINSPRDPVIGVLMVWDPAVLANETGARINQGHRIGFQMFTDPFIPDVSQVEEFPSPSGPFSQIEILSVDFYLRLPPDLRDRDGVRFVLKPRPEDEKPVVLVLEGGDTTNPSTSFIETKFTFQNFQQT